nr:MAG TPA: hypothetical protein [Caudoviricetes sp.]
MPYFRLNQKALKQYVISNDNIDLRGNSPLWVGQGHNDQPDSNLLLFSVVQLDFL